MTEIAQQPAHSLTTSLGRWALGRFSARWSRGRMIVQFPDGSREELGDPSATPVTNLVIRDGDFFRRLLLDGEIGFGEAYMEGLWETDDLVTLLELALVNRRTVGGGFSWLSGVSRWRNRRGHRANVNTIRGSKKNIRRHYDLGNDFFRLFLDETMTYSSAVFASPGQSLRDAQLNKYRVLCENAALAASDRLLEIGCGWGAFACYAAREYGCRVVAVTISQEQFTMTRQRIVEEGVQDLVEVRLCDYREIDGSFDKIVSIEMLEAVGSEHFSAFFEKCDALLTPGGRISLQVITIPDRSFAALRDGVNFMQKYIFPGGMLPSLSVLEKSLAGTELLISNVEDIGVHYVVTLRHWRERFLARLSEVRGLGFDDRFVRMWLYYLAASEAGFATRNTGDLQLVLDKRTS